MTRQYVIDGQTFAARNGYTWAAVDANGSLYQYEEKPDMHSCQWDSYSKIYWICNGVNLSTPWAETLTPATEVPTEPTLDDFCNRIYGSDFEKLDTQVQRWLENLYKKGALKL